MEIKELEVRIYMLAGQLEEAKKIYRDALGEVERATKEQADRKAKTETAVNGTVVSNGITASV